MKVSLTDTAEKQYRKLPKVIQSKADKQIVFLLANINHHRFEARVDYHYRLTFRLQKEEIFILSIGPHDTGLGKR